MQMKVINLSNNKDESNVIKKEIDCEWRVWNRIMNREIDFQDYESLFFELRPKTCCFNF